MLAITGRGLIVVGRAFVGFARARALAHVIVIVGFIALILSRLSGVLFLLLQFVTLLFLSFFLLFLLLVQSLLYFLLPAGLLGPVKLVR